MKYFFSFYFLFFILVACKTKDLTNNNEVVQENKIEIIKNKSFSIMDLNQIDKQDLLFNINEVGVENKQLKVNLQYGGGCVKPHVFELVTNGLIDKNGNMSFYLLHKTHNDKCKALLIENHVFDLTKVYNLKSNLLKTITINETKLLPL